MLAKNNYMYQVNTSIIINNKKDKAVSYKDISITSFIIGSCLRHKVSSEKPKGSSLLRWPNSLFEARHDIAPISIEEQTPVHSIYEQMTGKKL